MARVAKTTTKDIESFEHREARRKNMPTAELETLVSEGKQAPKTIRYKRNIDLDPQLASRQGRAGHRRPDGRRRADLHPREDPAGDAHSGPRAPILTGSPNPAPSASCASRLAGCGKSRDFGETVMKRARNGNPGLIKSTGYEGAKGDESGWKHHRPTFSAAC